MRKVLRFLFFSAALFVLPDLFSQPGCPSVNAGSDILLGCGETCTTLRAAAFAGATTASYTVDSIPYAPPFPFNAGTPILVNIDEFWSDTIDLPFNFTFFGNVYNQIMVGSNGMISFTLIKSGDFNSWEIKQPIPGIPFNEGDIVNSIMGPWQDMDPTFRGGTRYQITGTYPCRNFVVSWDSIPYYGDTNSVWNFSRVDTVVNDTVYPLKCSEPLFATQQIVIYEVTNVIEIYIKNKEVCPGWNNGRAIEGIHNATGTVAYTVPGRNATVWTAQNDAWRFTPSGSLNTTVSWFDGITPISNTDSVEVCPGAPHVYTAQATYSNSDGTFTTVTDDISVGFGGVTVQIDSVRQPTCFGDSTGAVFASFAVVDTGAMSFGWFPGGAGQTSLTNIPAGTYIFSVTDSAFCVHADTVVLSNPAQLLVTVSDSTNYSCTGSLPASLTAFASGGDTTGGDYQYEWITTETTSTITVTVSGDYTVTVTDMNGCTATDTGTAVLNFSNPVFNPPVITDVTCLGISDGTIVVSVDSVVPPIVFAWSHGLPNNDTVTGLSADTTYSVTATDALGCSVSASFAVGGPTDITIGLLLITQETCTEGGTLLVAASGGTGTLTYNWSNQDTGIFVDSLAPGVYVVTVTDQNLCTDSGIYTITAAPGLILGLPVITNLLCNGASNGSITISPTGGTGTIDILWSTGATTATISNLTAGCYSVTVSDDNSCVDSATYCVTEPPAITFNQPPIVVAATCAEGGSILQTATGGTPPLVYNWSNLDTGTFIDSLAAGPYIVTVTDSNLCTATVSVTVTAEISVVSFDTPTITHVLCNGGSNGSIAARASGGTGPITFAWSQETGPTIDSLLAGSYSVTVTDSVGCSASTTFIVNQPNPLVPVLSLSNPICINTTGFGSVSLSGGTPPYTYLWNNQSDSSYTEDLFPGPVSTRVTDANGCTASVSDTIRQAPDFAVTSIVRSFPCSVPAYGNDTIVVTGGLAPFTYILTGIDTNTTGVFNNLPSGNYAWVVLDSLGCSKSSNFTIEGGATSDNYDVAALPVSCRDSADGRIIIAPLTGNHPYSYSLNQGPFQSSNTFNNLPVGNYSIVAQNKYGCTASLVASIGEPAPDEFTIATTPVSCYGPQSFDGSITITPLSANGPYTYTYYDRPEQTDPVFLNVAAGTHPIIVRAATGCAFTIFATVDQPAEAWINAEDTIFVSSGVDRTIATSPLNLPDPVYTWAPAEGLSCTDCSNPTVSVSESTVYYVTVAYGADNCIATDSVVVIVQSGRYNVASAFTPNGDGKNDSFGPSMAGDIAVEEFRVYNRWGELVHNSPANWNGTFKGQDQPSGAYVYYVTVQVPDKNNPAVKTKENRQGSFLLIR